MAAKKKKPTGMKPATKQEDWRSLFVSKFPQYAKIIDGGQGEAEARAVFGNELVEIILDIARNPDQYDLTLQSGIDMVLGRVRATPYFENTSNARKEFDSLTAGEQEERVKTARINLAAEFGDYFLTTNELDMLARDIARSNLNGIARNQYVASRVGTRARGRDDVLQTVEADDIRKIAKAYGYRPADLDDQIFSAVTGQVYAPTGTVITADTIRAQGAQLAKAAYWHLSPQIDAGLTLDQIFSPYRQRAARMLERSEADISVDDPLFSMALNPDQNGKQMSLADWDRMVRTDQRFGYQYTTQANQDATNLGLSIARMFGGIK